jgi:hypothetical protein
MLIKSPVLLPYPGEQYSLSSLLPDTKADSFRQGNVIIIGQGTMKSKARFFKALHQMTPGCCGGQFRCLKGKRFGN